MRIIAGRCKGRTLSAPKGTGTRPTTDRVRESLMSCIFSARGKWEGARVLDLFAGSGALGLEALSRGAESACFCEKDPAALRALRSNAAMAPSDRVRIVQGDVLKRLPRAEEPFDLLFLDPPYAMPVGDVAAAIARLDEMGGLAGDALIVYEHDGASRPHEHPGFSALGLLPVACKRFGSTAIDVFRKGES